MQVNRCRTPGCKNAGVPVALDRKGRQGIYLLTATGKHQPAIKCLACGVSSALKNNAGAVQERRRPERLHGRGTDLEGWKRSGCSDQGCANIAAQLTDAAAFQLFGRSEAGSQRYRCRACGKTVSVPSSPTHRQRRSDKNVEIFWSDAGNKKAD